MFNPLFAKISGAEKGIEATARGLPHLTCSNAALKQPLLRGNKIARTPTASSVKLRFHSHWFASRAMQHIILYLSSAGTKTRYTWSNVLASPDASSVCPNDMSSSIGSAVRCSPHCSAVGRASSKLNTSAHTVVSQKKKKILKFSASTCKFPANFSHYGPTYLIATSFLRFS